MFLQTSSFLILVASGLWNLFKACSSRPSIESVWASVSDWGVFTSITNQINEISMLILKAYFKGFEICRLLPSDSIFMMIKLPFSEFEAMFFENLNLMAPKTSF